MDAALLVTWRTPIPGREKKAMALAAESNDFWGKHAAEGRCTPPEWFFLPDGRALWMVRGDRRALEELAFEGPGRALLAKGQLLLTDWKVELARTGEEAEKDMATWVATAEELGIY